MLPYCLKCKENTESIDPKVSATSNGRTIVLYVVYVVVKNQNLLKRRSKRIIK